MDRWVVFSWTGGWVSHGPVDGFLMDQYTGFHTATTPRSVSRPPCRKADRRLPTRTVGKRSAVSQHGVSPADTTRRETAVRLPKNASGHGAPLQDATAKKMLCFIFFNDKTLTSCSLTMVPTVGGWFSHGPVDGFLMHRWMVFSWTNTLVFTLQLHHVQT